MVFTVTRPSCFSFPGKISRPHGARLLTCFKSRQYMPVIKQCQLVHLKTTFNDILTESQSGFRPNHSTSTALISAVNLWLANMDAGKLNGSAFIDLKKAFDTVDHNILSCIVMVSMAMLFSCLSHL